MQDYNDYVTAINKIFDYVSKMKAGWNNPDNYANIEKIDDFKSLVANCADDFKKPAKEVIEEEPTEEQETTEETSSKDELSFPAPAMEMESEKPSVAAEPPEKFDPKNGPVEIKSEMPKINIKQDFSLPPINLPNETIVPGNNHSATQLTKLDTSNIPTLDEGDE